MPEAHSPKPLIRETNVLAFLLFRVFFNARFYYPVFALLFIDFGLTLSEFSLSNLVWAAAIVCLEVPSGALADVLGRKKLVVLAALLMLGEMAVLLWVEPKPGTMLLVAFVTNRLLSGAAEAMASGADEALVYDSLKEAGRENEWPQVLEWQTRYSSIAFFTVMLLGAAVYDPELMSRASQALGFSQTFSKADTLKIPIALTLGTGVLALFAALMLKPTRSEESLQESNVQESPFSKVSGVAKRLMTRKALLSVVLATVLFDQMARVSMTMTSQTLSSYGFGEATFGVIGAGFALLGALVSRPARSLVENHSKGSAFWLLVGLTLIGLLGQASFGEKYALVFVACLSMVMSLTGFFSSYYLNKMADSDERATLLSYKGLLTNIGFGAASLYYAGVSSVIPTDTAQEYLTSLYSLAAFFMVALVLFLLWKPGSESSE